jgi:hypothetical protein
LKLAGVPLACGKGTHDSLTQLGELCSEFPSAGVAQPEYALSRGSGAGRSLAIGDSRSKKGSCSVTETTVTDAEADECSDYTDGEDKSEADEERNKHPVV